MNPSIDFSNHIDIQDVLFDIATRGDCLYRKYGAMIVTNREIISYGFAHAVEKQKCNDLNDCPRRRMQDLYSNKAEFFEVCRVIHAEIDAILNSEEIKKLNGSTLYLLGVNSDNSIHNEAFPCNLCLNAIIKVGIAEIVVFKNDKTYNRFKVICY